MACAATVIVYLFRLSAEPDAVVKTGKFKYTCDFVLTKVRQAATIDLALFKHIG